MIDIASDIQSLSAFKRDTATIAARLKETGQPVVLTVNGKAEMVVQDAAAYQQLVEQIASAQKAEMMAFLMKSKADIDAGRTEPAIEALERLGEKLKLGGRK